MTKLLITTLGLVAYVALSAQPINRTFIEDDGDTILLGKVTPDRLCAAPFSQWYNRSYNAYHPNEESMRLISEKIGQVDSITIFMGTWCRDSRREVPRFLKIMKQVDFPMEKLAIVCVNHSNPAYKQSPGGEEVGLNIHRVPTIIFQDQDKGELNRFVERPVQSLEEDIIDILNGNYENGFRAVTYLARRLEAPGGISLMQTDINTLIEELSSMTANPYELNTYARMLLTSYQFAEAELVYELNVMIYPDFFIGNYYLAQLKYQLGKYKEARRVLEATDAPDQYEKQKLELMSDITQKSTL